MIQTKEYHIKSCDDAELGIKRESKLRFFLTYDDEKDIKSIICVIAGGGQDASSAYKEHLAHNVAKELGVAVLCVDYHGVGNRGWMGGKIVLEGDDIKYFKSACDAVEFRLDDDFYDHVRDEKYIVNLLDKLYSHVGLLKQEGRVNKKAFLSLTMTMIPRDNEYQNFGLMSACDVLNALFYVRKNPPFRTSAKYIPCVLVGSSHGGYVANMATKIAPWAIEAVVDNGSWTLSTELFEKKEYDYDAFVSIGFGKDIDDRLIRFKNQSDNLLTLISEKTFWSGVQGSPNYFSKARVMVRDVGLKEHLKAQAKIKKAHFVCYHGESDGIAPSRFKKEFYKYLSELGFSAKLHLVDGQDWVDGKFIKHLDHSFGMSIQSLILKEVPALLELIKNEQEYKGKKEISYTCDDLIYTFKESRNKIVLKCSKI